jgi:hypothetical protein
MNACRLSSLLCDCALVLTEEFVGFELVKLPDRSLVAVDGLLLDPPNSGLPAPVGLLGLTLAGGLVFAEELLLPPNMEPPLGRDDELDGLLELVDLEEDEEDLLLDELDDRDPPFWA